MCEKLMVIESAHECLCTCGIRIAGFVLKLVNNN